MTGAISVQEPRAVIHRQGGKATPRQVAVEARRERVALIVIEIEVPVRRRRKIRKPAGDGSYALGDLVRIHQVRMIAMEKQGGADGHLFALDNCAFDRQRHKDVRVANYIVVEEVARAGVEVSKA